MTREISATEADRSTARFRPEKEPIVIIGIGCRYPGGVKDVETFWQLLVAPGVGSQTKMLHTKHIATQVSIRVGWKFLIFPVRMRVCSINPMFTSSLKS